MTKRRHVMGEGRRKRRGMKERREGRRKEDKKEREGDVGSGKNWVQNRNISLSIRRKTRWTPCLTGAALSVKAYAVSGSDVYIFFRGQCLHPLK